MSLPSMQIRAGIHVVEAAEQVDDGGLACARRADQGNRFAGSCIQADVLQDGFVRFVAEGDVVEADVAVDVVERFCVWQIGDGLVFIHDFKDALCASQRRLQMVVEHGDAAHGSEKVHDVDDKRRNHADGDDALDGEPAAKRAQ